MELSSVRAERKIGKVNLTNTLTELLEEMQHPAEQQRVSESKRQNLETQLERRNKSIHGEKPDIELAEEQSTDVKSESRESKRCQKSSGCKSRSGKYGKLPGAELIASSW